jgi:hypothetical protein
MRRSIVLPALALVLATGCGGDDSTETVTVASTAASAEPLSKADYIAQADAICEEEGPAIEEIRDQANRLEEKGAYAASADKGEELVAALEAQNERLDALPAPAADQAILEQLADARDQRLAFTERLIPAMNDQEFAQVEALAAEIDSVDDKQEGISVGYGFKVCGQG